MSSRQREYIYCTEQHNLACAHFENVVEAAYDSIVGEALSNFKYSCNKVNYRRSESPFEDGWVERQFSKEWLFQMLIQVLQIHRGIDLWLGINNGDFVIDAMVELNKGQTYIQVM